MSVPKQKQTKSRRNKRRANIFLTAPTLISCPKCGKPVLPHIACSYCGYYKGREAINILGKLEKKEKKKREKEMKAKEAEEKQEKPLTMEGLSKK